MAQVEVVDVESPTQLDQFIKFPNKLYKGVPYYVTPLLIERKAFFDQEKNPFYKTSKVKLFLAMRDDEIVGRIATCINYTHNDFHHEKAGFFGFFDTIDDYEVAKALLKVAMITLAKEGADLMRGPMNFSTNHDIGFLIDGYDLPPTVMMPYNFPYQPRLAEKFGLKKVMDLNGYVIVKEDGISDRIQRVVDKLKQRSKVTIRTLKMRDYDNEVKRLNEVYNQAWAHNWGFVPMSEEEFTHMADDLKQICDPEMILIAEYEGKPVAFSIALPDINQALIHLRGRLFPLGMLKLLWHTKIRNKVNGVRLITMGVIPQFQKRGIDMIFFVETHNRGIARGYSWAELSWILETNELMCRSAEQMGGKLYKKYRIMEMPL
ncbi:MAG: N-acetyltransferase [bacterium]|nr:N-acetyltransferase [bacterium]